MACYTPLSKKFGGHALRVPT